MNATILQWGLQHAKRIHGTFTTVESVYTNALVSENLGIPYSRIIFVISTGYVLI